MDNCMLKKTVGQQIEEAWPFLLFDILSGMFGFSRQ